MPPSTFYELKIYIPPSEANLAELYVKAAEKQNRLVDNTCVPESCKNYDAGFDLFCPQEIPLQKKSCLELNWNCSDSSCDVTQVIVNHQLRCAMRFYSPECHEGRNVGYYLYCRSSTATKTPLRLANSVGIIDAGYRGDIIAAFDFKHNEIDRTTNKIVQYQRLVQLCPPNLTYPFRVTIVDTLEELGETERGDRGFGSTGQ